MVTPPARSYKFKFDGILDMKISQDKVFNKVAREAVDRCGRAGAGRHAPGLTGPPTPAARWTGTTPPSSPTARPGPGRRSPSPAASRSTPTAASSPAPSPTFSGPSTRCALPPPPVRHAARPAHTAAASGPAARGHPVQRLHFVPGDLQRVGLRPAGSLPRHVQTGRPPVRWPWDGLCSRWALPPPLTPPPSPPCSKVSLMEDEEGSVHLRNLSMHRVNNEEEALNLLFLVRGRLGRWGLHCAAGWRPSLTAAAGDCRGTPTVPSARRR